tara:strand:- start:139 stop:705 length:567 start_codon:yes stop_codon:yes gene_type:complete
LSLNRIIRLYDLTISLFLVFAFSPILLIIYFICFLESGKPLFVQKRVGKNKKIFNLIKFRSMHFKTPSLASHLVDKKLITRFGRIIRWLKLDELPQLFNVIKGEMSLVGPRPCLPNQTELIKERQIHGIFSVKPGITGLAQVKGIDMADPKKLVEVENYMISNFRQIYYFKYLCLTFYGEGIGESINN